MTKEVPSTLCIQDIPRGSAANCDEVAYQCVAYVLKPMSFKNMFLQRLQSRSISSRYRQHNGATVG